MLMHLLNLHNRQLFQSLALASARLHRPSSLLRPSLLRRRGMKVTDRKYVGQKILISGS